MRLQRRLYEIYTVSFLILIIPCNCKHVSLFLIFVKKQLQELTRVNPDRNIFSINVELTSTFLLYRGLVHHHHRVFKHVSFFAKSSNKPLKDYIQGRRLNLTLESLYLNYYTSSLQSQPLWVTL